MSNKPHKHSYLIKQWADGAIIEEKITPDKWALQYNPTWRPDQEYRIKPEPPRWYENIPKHGVLCWDKGRIVKVVKAIYRCDIEFGIEGTNGSIWWIKNPIPLTNAEILQFLTKE